MAAAGVPLFEIFLTVNKRGEYKQQVCFLYTLRVKILSVSLVVGKEWYYNGIVMAIDMAAFVI